MRQRRIGRSGRRQPALVQRRARDPDAHDPIRSVERGNLAPQPFRRAAPSLGGPPAVDAAPPPERQVRVERPIVERDADGADSRPRRRAAAVRAAPHPPRRQATAPAARRAAETRRRRRTRRRTEACLAGAFIASTIAGTRSSRASPEKQQRQVHVRRARPVSARFFAIFESGPAQQLLHSTAIALPGFVGGRPRRTAALAHRRSAHSRGPWIFITASRVMFSAACAAWNLTMSRPPMN